MFHGTLLLAGSCKLSLAVFLLFIGILARLQSLAWPPPGPRPGLMQNMCIRFAFYRLQYGLFISILIFRHTSARTLLIIFLFVIYVVLFDTYVVFHKVPLALGYYRLIFAFLRVLIDYFRALPLLPVSNRIFALIS